VLRKLTNEDQGAFECDTFNIIWQHKSRIRENAEKKVKKKTYKSQEAKKERVK